MALLEVEKDVKIKWNDAFSLLSSPPRSKPMYVVTQQ